MDTGESTSTDRKGLECDRIDHPLQFWGTLYLKSYYHCRIELHLMLQQGALWPWLTGSWISWSLPSKVRINLRWPCNHFQSIGNGGGETRAALFGTKTPRPVD
jgi:hypothetical protein